MSGERPTPARVRRDLIRLIGGGALLFLVALGARDLWNPNEPTYGRAVVEMAEHGSWLVPTVNGVAFVEKPILYFWLARAAALVTGHVDEATLRAPSALAGLLGIVLIYLLVYPYAGCPRARIAAVLFATTFIVFWSARAVQMDLMLAVSTLAAVLGASRALDQAGRPSSWWVLAGSAVGLGMLTKGPVGLICPALVVTAYLLVERRLRELRIRSLALAFAVAVAIALPWYVALGLRGRASLLYELLVRQNVTRFLHPWDHAEPWWYYLKYLWIDMAPWAFLLPLAAALPDRTEGERRLDRLCWSWIVSLLVFFSLSASKRSPYILPVAPAVAALAAAPVERLLRESVGRVRRWAMEGLLALAGGGLLAAGVYAAARALPRYPELGAAGQGAAVLLAVGGVAVIAGVSISRWRPQAGPAAFLATVVSLYLTAAVAVLPAADAYKSAAPFCAKLQALVPAGAPLRSYRFWKWRASYAFYTDRSIENIDSLDELRRYWNRGERVFLLVERGRIEEARSVIGNRAPLAHARIGGNAIDLFTNR